MPTEAGHVHTFSVQPEIGDRAKCDHCERKQGGVRTKKNADGRTPPDLATAENAVVDVPEDATAVESSP